MMKYIAKFDEELEQQGIQKPVLLFLDGHASHDNFQVAKECKKREIIFILLYPNTTSFTQPADKGVNGPIKKLYKTVLHDRAVDDEFKLSKSNFAQLIELICDEAQSTWIKNSFSSTGLFSFSFYY